MIYIYFKYDFYIAILYIFVHFLSHLYNIVIKKSYLNFFFFFFSFWGGMPRVPPLNPPLQNIL